MRETFHISVEALQAGLDTWLVPYYTERHISADATWADIVLPCLTRFKSADSSAS